MRPPAPPARLLGSAAAALLAVLLGAGPALAQTSSGLSAPRLQGSFALKARVTAAADVPGERVGQIAQRTWIFTPRCPTGACTTVGLARRRTQGTDMLVLRRTSSTAYTGQGAFYAPLRCAGRTYPRGESIPFTIAVHVVAASVVGGAYLATAIQATYTNRTRQNLTPCVAVLGHDSASYKGLLESPPTGGALAG